MEEEENQHHTKEVDSSTLPRSSLSRRRSGHGLPVLMSQTLQEVVVASRRHSVLAVDLRRVVQDAGRLIQEKVRKECPCVYAETDNELRCMTQNTRGSGSHSLSARVSRKCPTKPLSTACVSSPRLAHDADQQLYRSIQYWVWTLAARLPRRWAPTCAYVYTPSIVCKRNLMQQKRQRKLYNKKIVGTHLTSPSAHLRHFL